MSLLSSWKSGLSCFPHYASSPSKNDPDSMTACFITCSTGYGLIYFPLETGDTFHDLVKRGYFSEQHGSHGLIISAKLAFMMRRRRKRQRSRLCLFVTRLVISNIASPAGFTDPFDRLVHPCGRVSGLFQELRLFLVTQLESERPNDGYIDMLFPQGFQGLHDESKP